MNSQISEQSASWFHLIVSYISKEAGSSSSHNTRNAKRSKTIRQVCRIVEDQATDDKEEDQKHLHHSNEIYCISTNLYTSE